MRKKLTLRIEECGYGILKCQEVPEIIETPGASIYLYSHRDILSGFLKRHPTWREYVREKGDLWKHFGVFWRQPLPTDKETTERLLEVSHTEDKKYRSQRIPCPFLEDDSCEIYEVRPYVCASLIATTPREFCDPSSAQAPMLAKDVSIINEMFDVSFWHRGPLTQWVQAFMPIMVYEILKNGTYYFTKIPGLEDLHDEFMGDPEVKAILRRFVG